MDSYFKSCFDSPSSSSTSPSSWSVSSSSSSSPSPSFSPPPQIVSGLKPIQTLIEQEHELLQHIQGSHVFAFTSPYFDDLRKKSWNIIWNDRKLKNYIGSSMHLVVVNMFDFDEIIKTHPLMRTKQLRATIRNPTREILLTYMSLLKGLSVAGTNFKNLKALLGIKIRDFIERTSK
jgi:hypothetical protein